jgi:hypothetical protein
LVSKKALAVLGCRTRTNGLASVEQGQVWPGKFFLMDISFKNQIYFRFFNIVSTTRYLDTDPEVLVTEFKSTFTSSLIM